jgi:hypothetical protein
MNPLINHPPLSVDIYATILAEGTCNIPSSTNKSLIHRGISHNIIPLDPSINIYLAFDKAL